ncbi:50S ribosomal protein L6 [Candidatus Shapirobacteria bacterium CG03_land_8_20_14_0_80_39_12]|uniref:50S ribosomal protein L6 n=1 Tax=Candidatus Shapirobacteria bacterium CG03_land_8_20_14_0_80_39_12 TaxID=1974879 RepID=A0A2M7BEI9_9BACT|nr:MAG: 50S ribosomal protein L6 [Candidatus Shapirobacteria bacterium CG03_land_8_20_14_0_80_39_12]
MSKIGVKPIIVKEGNTITREEGQIVVRGPLGEVRLSVPEGIKTEIGEGKVQISRFSETRKNKSSHGTLARLIANALSGTRDGFSKVLEVVGTGFRAQMEGTDLVLALGFSHLVRFPSPEGIKIEVIEGKIKIFGVDKELVARTASNIKKIKKPDAYKGKGILYQGEKLKLKPGKAAAKAGPGGAAAGGK